MNRGQVAAGRRLGASPEARERMRAEDEKAIWTATCRRCGAELKGTLAEIKAHACKRDG